MRLQVEVLLPSHLAGALNHMVALLGLKDLVHVATVNPLAPTLLTHQVCMLLFLFVSFIYFLGQADKRHLFAIECKDKRCTCCGGRATCCGGTQKISNKVFVT